MSKRNVPYWWAPEWIRGTSADPYCSSYGVIRVVKTKNGKDVELCMESKDGNQSYIKGSIQVEFKKWHTDRQIDYMLLGGDPDELLKREDD